MKPDSYVTIVYVQPYQFMLQLH